MAADLALICDACKTSIADDDGYLWIDNDAVNKASRAYADWERQHTVKEGPLEGGVMYGAGALFDLPDDVPWQAHHAACDPNPDANGYPIPAEKLRTWGALLDWTAHLMEKSWLAQTDWAQLLRNVVGGSTRLVAAPGEQS
ncbi:hypothetical protein [Streptomyces sp. ME19-01-6]|uniref:hypothetical protein n=1 Tax=Streptomyces sp. ME19-01-6 TaxID=3028686 RepID=UPI0029B06F16|nr:hypothetical protein [Streptomyces sp. ME19-01-6]MDX3229410.1 hypothetical protein [Streptomyces sp. ME19-01-6]